MEIKVLGNENEVYIKDKLLGQGAFGKAYLVKHKQTNEQLVIKEMSIQHMSSKEKEQTIKEAQILKNLNHPNIVNFREVYITKNNKLKIVMEYAECGDLAKAISLRKAKNSPFDEKQILDWFTQICLAIKHVHDRKILHRDIKGQNIFIAKNNSLKLGDFGIARVLNKTHEKARTVVGTPYYLSPQIIENKPYSFKSDIWSIGAVLYQMCALAPPFTAASLQMLALKIVKGSYPPIKGNYSMQLKNLISEMLTLDPNRRPGVNQILQKPVIKDRIRNFLSETKRVAQFSHTILHNQKVEIFANKLVQIQKQKQTPRTGGSGSNSQSREKKIEAERAKLKEDQRKMQLLMQKKKEDEERKKQDDIRRRQLQAKRREQQKKKWIKIEQQKKQRMQRQYEQNARRADVMRARRQQQQKEYQRKMEMEELKRQKYQYEDKKWRQGQQQKKKMKMMEDERKKQELNDFARQQYFQNLQIRKRAQERAKRDQQSYYSEPPQQQPQPEKQNFHYQPESKRPSSSRQDQRPGSKDRQKRPNNSDCYNNKKPAYQPTEEQLQNAFVNPNFNRKKTDVNKKSSESNEPQNRRNSVQNSKHNGSDEKKQESRRRIEQAREKMRKDKQKYIRDQGRGGMQNTPIGGMENYAEQQKQCQPIHVGKWGKKKSSSKQRQIDSPRFGEREKPKPTEFTNENPKNEQGKGFNTLIQDSDNMFLQAKNPIEFENYVDELEGILNDVNRRIQMLPEIPIADEILFRDDDELQFSLTAEPADLVKKKKQEDDDIETEEVDLDYFSNYSKLETLRIQLQQAFGLDNFIRLYRYIQKQVSEKGLEGFDIVEAIKQVGADIDRKILTKNLTLLLTLVSLQDRMSFT